MPGKLPALVDRFGKHTVQIWKRHDIRPVGFWTVDIGENTNDLFYMLQWDDLGHRERASAAFQADKEWITARAQSEAGGADLECHLHAASAHGFLGVEVITASAYWRPARPSPT